MKRFLLIFTTCMLFTPFVNAQKRNDLTGPRAKNYVPWRNNSEKPAVIYIVKTDRVTGPQAKNKKHWIKSQKPEEREYVNITTSSRHNLKGPRAKNHNPWLAKPHSKKVGAKTSSEDQKQKAKQNQSN